MIPTAGRMMTRRDALRAMSCGFGSMSLAGMVGQSLVHAAVSSHAPWMHTNKPRAKHVIFLFMNGGMSQVDSFDSKPMLAKYHGQAVAGGTLMKSPFAFSQHGQSGIEVSEIFPHLAACVDEMCFVKSVYTEGASHEQARAMVNTGTNIPGQPSLGSWITHGLGTLNPSLPGFVTLCSEMPAIGPPNESAIGMQPNASDVFEGNKESAATRRLYGEGSAAHDCLTAARLIERGVRMVQVNQSKGDPWDHHFNIERHRNAAHSVDQPFAALIKDLKSRGLLDDTILVAGSEFGRAPFVEAGAGFMGGRAHSGRDHNPHGFTMWIAGGGFKKGFSYGATDDFGRKAVENPVHVRDIHATILWQLGIDHTKLTYHDNGGDYRFTGLNGSVVHNLIA